MGVGVNLKGFEQRHYTIEIEYRSFYYLMRDFFNRRCKMQPLWLDVIFGGMQDNEPLLVHANIRGKAYTGSCDDR